MKTHDTPTATTRADVIKRMEFAGSLDPTCPGCREFYESPDPAATFAPRHKASYRCESGKRPHCTCDTCW